MSRPNPFVLTAGFLLFIGVFGGLPLLKGGLYLDTHEGDSYHLLDILLRIDAGLTPHLDFPTPIGFLAFLLDLNNLYGFLRIRMIKLITSL